MIPLRWLALVRDYRRHPWLPALSVLGVALGVAVVVALDLAIESALGSMRESTEAVAGRATHQITGATGPVDERLYARLRLQGGIREASPIVEGFVRATGIPDRPLRLLGVDPFAEAAFRSFTGRGNGSTPLTPGSSSLVVSAAMASEHGLVPGDSLEVRGPRGTFTVEIAALFGGDVEGGDGPGGEATADLLVADLSLAQRVLDRIGRLDRIDLVLPGGDEETRLLAGVAALLPPDASVRTAGARSDGLVGMTRAFELNLTALSLLALVFGIFLIYNAMTFSVVRRRERIGMMHALGVTRREVVAGLLVEAGMVGLAGALLGCVAGVVLGRGLVGLVTQTVNDLYSFVHVDGLQLAPSVLLKGIVLGVLTTLVATLAPALEAAGGGGTRTMRRSALEDRVHRRVRGAAVIGIVAAFGALAAFSIGPSSGLGAAFVGLGLVMAAIALVTPLASIALARVLSPVAGGFSGLTGRMAVRGVVRSLSRTGPALAALVVAVSVTVGLGAMITSFRGTVERWLAQTLQADVYVSAASLGASRTDDPLPAAFVDGLRTLEGADQVSLYRGLDFDGAWGPMRLVSLDLAPRGESAFRFTEGEDGQIIDAFRRDGAVLVSEPFTSRTGIGAGSEIVLPTPAGERSFPVAGTYFDYGSDRGVIMMAATTYRRYWTDDRVTSVGLFAAPGMDAQRLVAGVRRLPEAEWASVRSNRSLREASLVVFDRTFTVTGVLRLLAFVVAFIGILGALMAIELERSHEFGLLRATGLTPAELRRLILTETGLMGLMAGILAIPAGAVLAAVMVFIINKRSFGWSLDLTLGADIVLQSFALAVLGALLAGVYPAIRIARGPTATVLRDD